MTSLGALLLLSTSMLLQPASAIADRGDQSGPGYRGPDGKCVGWAELARKCGSPPTQRCTTERAQPEATDAASQGAKIRQFKDAAHQRATGLAR